MESARLQTQISDSYRSEVAGELAALLQSRATHSVPIEQVLALLGARFEVHALTFWSHLAKSDAMVCRRVWIDEGFGEPASGFAIASLGLELPRGLGLPGRALRAAATVVSEDLPKDLTHLRREPAARFRLDAGCAIPVASGGNTFAVIEGFAIKPRNDFRSTAAALASVIGEVAPLLSSP